MRYEPEKKASCGGLALSTDPWFPSLGSSPWFDFQKSISRCTYCQDPCQFTSLRRPLGPAVQRWAPSISPWSPVCLLYPILSSSSGGSCNFHWGGVRIWELPETDVDHSSVHRYLFFFRWPFVSFGVAWLFTTIEAKHFSPTDLGNFWGLF